MKRKNVLSGLAVAALLGVGVAAGTTLANNTFKEVKADSVLNMKIEITVTNYDSSTMQFPKLNYWYTGVSGTYLESFVQDTSDSTLFTASLSGVPSGAEFGCRVALWDNADPWTERAYYSGEDGAWFHLDSITASGTLVASGAVDTVSNNSIGTFSYNAYSEESYIYYVSGSESATENYIYSFGGDCQFGSWTGTKVVEVPGVSEVHGVLHFNGTVQNIYKIPYHKDANDTHVILNDGSNQTANMTLSEGCAYTFESGKDGTNANMGLALDLLLAAEAKRNAVAADTEKKILKYSICGISASDAATLYNTYYALNYTAKDYVDATNVYTYNGAYDGTNVPSETMISYSDVMDQLKAIAVAGGQTVSGAFTIGSSVDETASVAITAVLASLGLATFAGLIYFSKKRKHVSL